MGFPNRSPQRAWKVGDRVKFAYARMGGDLVLARGEVSEVSKLNPWLVTVRWDDGQITVIDGKDLRRG